MPPKKTEERLEADLHEQAAWAQRNHVMTRATPGANFEAKLRQHRSKDERSFYVWYKKHAERARDFSSCVTLMCTLDSLVVSSVAASSRAIVASSGAGPAAATAASTSVSTDVTRQPTTDAGSGANAAQAAGTPVHATACPDHDVHTPRATPVKQRRCQELKSPGHDFDAAEAGAMSPSCAVLLAQSCRKSPAPPLASPFGTSDKDFCQDTPLKLLEHSQFASLSFLQKRGLAAEGEARLLNADGLRPRVKELYLYVRGQVVDEGDEFVPRKVAHSAEQQSKLKQMHGIRKLHRQGLLKAADLSLLALVPQVLGPESVDVFGDVETVNAEHSSITWRWIFAPAGLYTHGPACSSKDEAFAELCKVRAQLYPEWHEEGRRDARLKHVVSVLASSAQAAEVLQDSRMRFARNALAPAVGAQGLRLYGDSKLACGLQNLGNTCYISSVVQCLFHCRPVRQDMEQFRAGNSFMGDKLLALWHVYKRREATNTDLMGPS